MAAKTRSAIPREKSDPFVIKDLTAEAYWDRAPDSDERDWLSSIARLCPAPYVLNMQLEADHGPTIEPILTRGIDGWRANRYIGEIRHQGRTLVIEPRLGIDRVISWISTILDVQVLPHAARQSMHSSNAVIQLLAALWRASVLAAGQHALPRTRQKTRSYGVVVNGRLDAGATARRRAAGLSDLAFTRVSRSYDHAAARAVVLADRYFSRHLAGNGWRGARLDEHLRVMRAGTGARPKKPSMYEVQRASYSPITTKWRRAAELSLRISNEDPLGVAADDDSTSGVLIDVAELWEMFVLKCAGLATTQPVQHGTTAGAAGHLARSTVDPRHTMGKLYPDVLVGTESPVALVDAKYKILGGRRGVDREDLYQLHAYSSTVGAPLAALAYPSVDDIAPRDERDSPWETKGGAFWFLALPTDQEKCVEKLRRWLSNFDV